MNTNEVWVRVFSASISAGKQVTVAESTADQAVEIYKKKFMTTPSVAKTLQERLNALPKNELSSKDQDLLT